jgi:hypothetical protein
LMSPALSFSGTPKRGAFHALILSGEKTMTTRMRRKDGRPHCAVGDVVSLYWKMRTPVKDKPIHLIGGAYVVGVRTYPNMHALLIGLGGTEGLLYYVHREGFNDLGELLTWWVGVENVAYGITDEGIMITPDTKRTLEESGPVEVIEWQYPLVSRYV